MNRQKLWNEVDHILWEEWDPIGASDCGGPNDEYRSYVLGIVDLLLRGENEIGIANRLHHLVNVNMGLSSEFDDNLDAATK